MCIIHSKCMNHLIHTLIRSRMEGCGMSRIDAEDRRSEGQISNGSWPKIEFNNRDPVYLQVVRHFKEWIAEGRLVAGQTIPSRRELAMIAKINPNTAQRAYREMEEQGLIVTEGNSPSRITSNEEVLRAIRSELLNDAVELFMDSIKNLHVSAEELMELIRAKLSEAEAKSGEGEGHD